jgi:hypothetical protein
VNDELVESVKQLKAFLEGRDTDIEKANTAARVISHLMRPKPGG